MLQLLAEESASLLELATDFSEGKSYNYWGDFVNMIVTLMIIVGLIFISIIVLKKIMRSRLLQVNRGAKIKILERRPLNQKASLYLVDIMGKSIVVGESQAGIHLISELGETVEEEVAEPAPVFSLPKTLKKMVKKNA